MKGKMTARYLSICRVASITVILVLMGNQTLILNKIIIDSVKIGENPQHSNTKEFLIKREKYKAI